jgi:hypothetical protein
LPPVVVYYRFPVLFVGSRAGHTIAENDRVDRCVRCCSSTSTSSRFLCIVVQHSEIEQPVFRHFCGFNKHYQLFCADFLHIVTFNNEEPQSSTAVGAGITAAAGIKEEEATE